MAQRDEIRDIHLAGCGLGNARYEKTEKQIGEIHQLVTDMAQDIAVIKDSTSRFMIDCMSCKRSIYGNGQAGILTRITRIEFLGCLVTGLATIGGAFIAWLDWRS